MTPYRYLLFTIYHLPFTALMASRLTVIFFIVLCLEAGIFLTVLPWWQPWGMGGWGENYFLVFAAQKIGLPGLQHAVASGWVRGAVTGLGLLNLAMAFWEMFHFRETVRRLQGLDSPPPALRADATTDDSADGARVPEADHLPRHERRDD
jgi:hypothetical protein